MNQFFKPVKPVLLACFALVLFLTACNNHKEERPNIIIFFTDDQGYADLGTYGAEGFTTPNLDTLATTGIKFTNFYVPATVCTPSRAALLTGKYPKRTNLHQAVLFPFSEGGLAPAEVTMAEILKESGYTTSCIGKWHLGHKAEFMPNNQGFDEFYGVPYSNDMDNHYYPHKDFTAPPLPLYRNTTIVENGPDQRYLTKKYTEEAIRIIKAKGGKPFFMYLAHNMPHVPLYASPKFKGKSENGIYGDVIMELDWSAGEIIKALKEEGLYDNTIFVFTSDNGPHKGSAKPLRGKKAETWEGGQRVPGIISWPAKIPANKIVDQVVTTLDLYPTLAHIATAKIPETNVQDGLDITQLLLNPDSTNLPERPFYYYARNGELEAVRLGKWKLHTKKSNGWNTKMEGEFQVSLYNLETDIAEKLNVVSDFPEVARQLKKLMITFDDSL
ncbi:sulfatase [Cellulophaga sp. F20128]|uniref:sulfatase family protein n=1 Tax=Cellulophaga sp. F20128 TaxID=2926413 RepID=UPI001FF5B344|nr:sulfatase [Cellulophaga sp. F20128]MCK0158093.1 sulfatase [Cellulophaga sp. F20128]